MHITLDPLVHFIFQCIGIAVTFGFVIGISAAVAKFVYKIFYN